MKCVYGWAGVRYVITKFSRMDSLPNWLVLWLVLYLILRQNTITIKQDSYAKANESGDEAQKETRRLIDIGLPQSKNKS